ncbi:hypothetical protein AMTRI_Chr04g183770 [Amborella trichopoda]
MKPSVLLMLLSPLPSSLAVKLLAAKVSSSLLSRFLSMPHTILLCCPTHNLSMNSNPKSRIKLFSPNQTNTFYSNPKSKNSNKTLRFF